MLTLPERWQTYTTAYVVKSLLKQADAVGKYPLAARAFARAAFDFMMAGPRWQSQTSPPVPTEHPKGWQLNAWFFYVVPQTDDAALHAIADLPKVRGDIDVLAPPWSTALFENAVKVEYPKRRIDVIGVDMFCAYRLFWTGLDLGHERGESITDLLNRYRRLVQPDDALMITPA